MQQCTVHRKQYSVHSECSAHAHSQKSTLPKVLTALLSSHPHKSTLPNVLIAQYSLLTPRKVLYQKSSPLSKVLAQKCSPLENCSTQSTHPSESAPLILLTLTSRKNALPIGLTPEKVLTLKCSPHASQEVNTRRHVMAAVRCGRQCFFFLVKPQSALDTRTF